MTAVAFLDQDLIDQSNVLDGRSNNKGRPKGVVGTYVRKTEPWDPKKLTPEHYAVLSLRAAGLKMADIGKEIGKSKVWVNSVCNSKKGKAYLDMMKDAVAKRFQEETVEKLTKTSSAAADNVAVVLEDKDLRELQPFQMFDRSLRFLQAAGKIGADGTGAGGNKFTAIGDSAIEAMSKALIEANGVRARDEIVIEAPKD